MVKMITNGQRNYITNMLLDRIEQPELFDFLVQRFLKRKFKVDSLEKLTVKQAGALIVILQHMQKRNFYFSHDENPETVQQSLDLV